MGALCICKLLKSPFVVAKREITLCQQAVITSITACSSGQTANQSAVRKHINHLNFHFIPAVDTLLFYPTLVSPPPSSGGWGAKPYISRWQWPGGSSQQLEPGGESRGMPWASLLHAAVKRAVARHSDSSESEHLSTSASVVQWRRVNSTVRTKGWEAFHLCSLENTSFRQFGAIVGCQGRTGSERKVV